VRLILVNHFERHIARLFVLRVLGPYRYRNMNSAVLIVDDEPLVREMLAEMLGGMGLVILVAGESGEALEILKRTAHQVAILVNDVRMPGAMDGLDLANIAQRCWPWIRGIVMSAHYETGPDRCP
jgi:CheY-like chemotaxis protein